MRKMLFILMMICFVFGYASAETKRFVLPLEGSPFLGPKDAPVTIVEFIDYQ